MATYEQWSTKFDGSLKRLTIVCGRSHTLVSDCVDRLISASQTVVEVGEHLDCMLMSSLDPSRMLTFIVRCDTSFDFSRLKTLTARALHGNRYVFVIDSAALPYKVSDTEGPFCAVKSMSTFVVCSNLSDNGLLEWTSRGTSMDSVTARTAITLSGCDLDELRDFRVKVSSLGIHASRRMAEELIDDSRSLEVLLLSMERDLAAQSADVVDMDLVWRLDRDLDVITYLYRMLRSRKTRRDIAVDKEWPADEVDRLLPFAPLFSDQIVSQCRSALAVASSNIDRMTPSILATLW